MVALHAAARVHVCTSSYDGTCDADPARERHGLRNQAAPSTPSPGLRPHDRGVYLQLAGEELSLAVAVCRLLGELEPEADFIVIDLTDNDNVRKAKLEMWVAQRLGSELLRIYPKRNWRITVDTEAGIAVVQEPDISQTKGYVLSLDRSLADLEQQMMRVGGEILERARLSRDTVFDPERLERVLRDFRDEVVSPDLLAPEEERALKRRTGG